MKRTGKQVEAAKEEARAKAEKAKEQLVEAVGALQTSDDWKAMLKRMAVRHELSPSRLSFGNMMLVYAQAPEARLVGTYRTWQERGRQVRKGERAIYVLAPVIAGGKKEREEKGEEGPRVVGFRAMAQFAEYQTDKAEVDGQDLPEFESPCRDIEAPAEFALTVDQLREVALMIEDVRGVYVGPRSEHDSRTARGCFVFGTGEIRVFDDVGRAMQIKTLVHEMAHAILHDHCDPHGRAEQEVEAESVAYVVCSALGLDTGDYSFGYVAHWAGGEDAAKDVLASGERISRAAGRILDALHAEEGEEGSSEVAA